MEKQKKQVLKSILQEYLENLSLIQSIQLNRFVLKVHHDGHRIPLLDSIWMILNPNQ